MRLHWDALPDEGLPNLPTHEAERAERLSAWHALGRDVYATLKAKPDDWRWTPPPGWDEFGIAINAGVLRMTDMSWITMREPHHYLLDRPILACAGPRPCGGPSSPHDGRDICSPSHRWRQIAQVEWFRRVEREGRQLSQRASSASLKPFQPLQWTSFWMSERVCDPSSQGSGAAISRAASEIELNGDGQVPNEELRRIYHQTVAPSQQEFSEALHDLRVRQTLMRGAGSVVAAIGVVAGAAVSIRVLAAAAGVPIGQAVKEEMKFRRSVREKQRNNPFAFLCDADALLRR